MLSAVHLCFAHGTCEGQQALGKRRGSTAGPAKSSWPSRLRRPRLQWDQRTAALTAAQI